MSAAEARPLDFRAVDDLAFAAERGRLDLARLDHTFVGRRLGPLLELYQLRRTDPNFPLLRGPWLDVDFFSGLGGALVGSARRWAAKPGPAIGVLKGAADVTDADLIAFMMDAKRAATESGLSSDWAAQMVAALGEFHSNIVEHSGARESGFVAFSATPGSFEFVASDCGVGLLATLREAPECRDVESHGDALRLALTDGTSRFGVGQGRGYGFRPLFIGLANRQAELRFRTGDACLVVDGTSPSLARSQAGRKAVIGGFLISVACRVTPQV